MAAKVKAFFQEIFALIDKDNSGVLEPAELKSVLIKIAPAIGEDPNVPIPEEAVKMLAESLDANGDGKITVEDFYVALANTSPFSSVEEMWADLDGPNAENVDAGIASMRANIMPLLA